MEELKNIFTASCVESAARKAGCSTGEMYQRMKRVGLIHGFIMPGYEVLHTQSREHVTEDVLGALHIWEQKYVTALPAQAEEWAGNKARYYMQQEVVDKYLHFVNSYQVQAYAK